MKTYQADDHVKWNSEVDHMFGKILKVHHSEFKRSGYTPQGEVILSVKFFRPGLLASRILSYCVSYFLMSLVHLS